MLSAIAESGLTYHLTARSERPIEGCVLTPHVFLQLKGGNAGVDNSTRAKLLDSVPYQYVYKWRRSKVLSMCGNPGCSKGSSFDPAYWSRIQSQGPSLACAVCLNAGKLTHEALFCCSSSCFQNAWKEHSKLHAHYAPGSRSKSRSSSVALQKDSDVSEVYGVRAVDEVTNAAVANSRSAAQESHSASADRGATTSQSVGHDDWELICAAHEYTPTDADVGCRFCVEVAAVAGTGGGVLAGPLCVYTEAVLSKPVFQKRTFAVVPKALGISSSFRFRIMSYNILAEMLATKQYYPYCDSWVLSWPYRKTLILQELSEMQSDICCLQEVQADHFDLHLSPFMTQCGYDGMFKPKSRDYAGNFGKIEGCAIFWKRNKFIMSESHSVDFQSIARREISGMGLGDADQRRYLNKLGRENIAQIVVFESLQQRTAVREKLCVVNTHLHSNVLNSDVKLWQALKLAEEVKACVASRDLPILLCGDFNSEPTSAVYEFMTNGSVLEDHPEIEQALHNRIPVLPRVQLIGHDLQLSSAMFDALGKEPDFTNLTGTFRGVLDYIFYNQSRVRILATCSIPSEAEIVDACGPGLPCATFPSDHIMLCCDVAIIPSSSSAGNRQYNFM